jgi:hypothetical protein
MRGKIIFLAILILCGVLLLPPGLWALTSNKDIIVDDDSGDSPQIILRDQDEKTLTLQKLDTGEGNITNSEGAINIQPSTDTVHYLSLSTASNLTGIYWKGHYTNDPAIRINSSGKLEYRDENESAWTTLDSLAGGGSGGAPTDATYITQTANSSLSGEQALGSLASGILKNTTTTGILSIATAGTDYYNPGGTDVAVADGGTGTSNGSITGTTALTFTAGTDGGADQAINIRPAGDGYINFNNTNRGRTSYVNQWGDIYIDAAGSLYTNGLRSIDAAFTITEASNRNIVNFTNSSRSRTAYINEWGDIYTDSAGALYAGSVSIAGATINAGYALEMPNDANKKARAHTFEEYSDSRIKTEQQPIHYGLSQILMLRPKKYNQHDASFKNGKLELAKATPMIGLIAQEVYQIIPEAASKPADENKELWSMDYNKLVPVLVKAIQEQQAQIDELKKQIAALQKQSK